MDILGYITHMMLSIALTAFAVYIVFYEFFQRVGGRRVSRMDPAKYKPVMSGLPVERVDYVSPTYIALDVLRRAWRHSYNVLARWSETLTRDWFFYALILLTVMSLVLLLIAR